MKFQFIAATRIFSPLFSEGSLSHVRTRRSRRALFLKRSLEDSEGNDNFTQGPFLPDLGFEACRFGTQGRLRIDAPQTRHMVNFNKNGIEDRKRETGMYTLALPTKTEVQLETPGKKKKKMVAFPRCQDA